MNIPLPSDFLEFIDGKRVTVTAHVEADIDAVASGLTLAKYLSDQGLGKKIFLYIPTVSRVARAFLERMDLDLDEMDDFLIGKDTDDISDPGTGIGGVGRMIVVDTASPNMVPFPLDEKRAAVIDHHKDMGDWSRVKVKFIEPAPSCAELIVDLTEEWLMKPDNGPYRKLLACGILADTHSLRNASPSTLSILSRILEEGRLGDLFNLLSIKLKDQGEQNAILKGAQRMRYENVGPFVVAWSVIGAYEASVARKIILLGADIVFVGTERKGGKVRVIGRANDRALASGVDLTLLVKRVKESMSLDGGGHNGAAGVQGRGDVEAVIRSLITELKDLVSSGKIERK